MYIESLDLQMMHCVGGFKIQRLIRHGTCSGELTF